MKQKEMIVRKDWVRCPNCGCKLAIVDNTAKVDGLYIKCRICKQEVKIKI